ncbi:Tankyrase-2 [Nymphon striatum]|nr:Tankyrase-2 [Nymphon striatum]
MAARRPLLATHQNELSNPNDCNRDLFEACRNGDVTRVKKLGNPQNVNARDTAGRKSSPLHFAAGFGRGDVVEHLLLNGANVHAKDDGGLIPLHNGCSFGHAEVVQLLLKHGADSNARDNWNYTPLHEAAIKGKIDVCIESNAKLVIFYGPEDNFFRFDFQTANLMPSDARLIFSIYKEKNLRIPI